MFFDFFIKTNIDISKLKIFNKVVNNLINKKNKIDIVKKSTRGKKSIQYDFSKNKEQLISIEKEILNKLKEIDFKKENLLEENKNYSNFKLISAWTVLGKENSYHEVHRHNENIKNHLATVLYLNMPKKNNMHQTGDFFCFLRKDNGIEYIKVNPKQGDLFIMPVQILHGSYPQSKGLRQTLNMDFEVL